MTQVFASWSGGKDSCFACYRAAEAGLEVRYLINMMVEDAKRSWSHGLSSELLQMQAQAIGIPLVQRWSTMANYGNDFGDVILTLKENGVGGGVFGDIDLEAHREWIEQLCQQVDITPYLPLWGLAQAEIIRDFIGLGFEAIIVVARADLFGEEWLGRKVDLDFLSRLTELEKTSGVTVCGESGEYHTFVTDGPLFKQRVEIMEARRELRGGHWFLEIAESRLVAK